MTRALPPFLRALLAAESPIDPVLQEPIYRYMVGRKLWTELGVMAARTDTTPALDALLAKHKEIDVVAGWVSRPGRTDAELTTRLAAEKRVKALLVLAQRPDLPAEVYERIAAVNSKNLDLALANNPSVPAALRVEKLVSIADSSRYSVFQLRQYLLDLTSDDQTLLSEVSERTVNLVAMNVLVGLGIASDKTLLRYCDAATGTPPANPVENPSWYASDTCREELLLQLSQHRLDGKRRKKLETALRAVAAEYTHWSHMREKFLQAAEGVAGFDESFHERIAEFASATDPQKAVTLLGSLLTDVTDVTLRGRVLHEMSVHRYVPSAVSLTHVGDLQWEQENLLTREWLRRGDLPALAQVVKDDYREPEWFREMSVTDRSELLRHIVDASRSENRWPPSWVLRVDGVDDHLEVFVSCLPWPQLSESVNVVPALLSAVQALLAAKTGQHPQFWENFETLADEFDGSLQELLDAATAL